MIHDVKDVSALLDRRFGSAGKGLLSALRVLVWIGVGLLALGALLPAPKVDLSKTHYNSIMPTRAVRDLTLDKNDPRGWYHLNRDRSKFTIAWIGSSTLQNVGGHYSFVPADVRNRVPRINGKPVRVDMYLLEGGRLADLFNSVVQAISTKPDLIMVDLNPLWLFNDRQIQEWENLNGVVFDELVGDPSSWPLLAALDSPQDVALGLAGTHVPVVRDRWSSSAWLRDTLADLQPMNPARIDPSTPAAAPTGLARVHSMQSPLAFWNYYRPLVPLNSPTRVLQEELLRRARTRGSVINDDVVTAMLRELKSSSIPSVAYLSAVDPSSLGDPGVDPALRRVEARLAQLARGYESPTLTVKPDTATRVLQGLTFKDFVHMTYDRPMVDYLTALVCAQVLADDPSAQCAPVSR